MIAIVLKLVIDAADLLVMLLPSWYRLAAPDALMVPTAYWISFADHIHAHSYLAPSLESRSDGLHLPQIAGGGSFTLSTLPP